MYSMTSDKVAALLAQLKDAQAQLAAVEASSPTQMWLADLDAFDAAYAQHTECHRAKYSLREL
jgi:hypothetical protein